ncbi:DNA repair protein RadC [Paenibacillus odorifer]|uniref:JAB domain-containing protein n=1 Tax=Paenibacillus odorifer TaxID=189426 RepID=UPI00096FD28D|nr:DNA repair protein RadC [Paenibacillus odorifer]OME28907.1 DNA repair protein RadC [Paenibacillus odorifer]
MTQPAQQLELFSGNLSGKKAPAKRVNIVSLKMVRESSILYPDRNIRSPQHAVKLLQHFLQDADREYFLVVCLDTKNQVNSITTCHIGTLNASVVHPRECFKTAILSNAASIIVAHNHPSGNTTPSPEDLSVTKRLKEAGELLGVELLDHLIIAGNDFCSLKESGYLQK